MKVRLDNERTGRKLRSATGLHIYDDDGVRLAIISLNQGARRVKVTHIRNALVTTEMWADLGRVEIPGQEA